MTVLSVIISTYNGLDKLQLTLNAYKNQTLSDFEIIVACDGSSDGTIEFIKNNKNSYPYQLRAVWHEDQGYRLARIRNCAWRIANSNRVIFTDQDIIPNADCLMNYAIYENEEVAITGYIGWIDSAIHSVFTIETISQIKNFEPFMTQPEMRDFKKYNSWILWGGNMSVTKKLYELTGGFDEDFIAWGGEDTDLGVRCDMLRYPIKVLPEAKMFHMNHERSNSLNAAGSELFYKVKQYDKTTKRNINADYLDVISI